MLKNYFKIAWRNIYKNKLYSAINIGGLGVGMAVSFMLMLYVYNELTFDKKYKNDERIFTVLRHQPANGEIQTGSSTSVPMAAAMLKDYPEIEKAARMNWPFDKLFTYQDKSININTASVDPSFLDIFSLEFVKGNRATAFSELSSIVLTESGAQSLFGTEDPMGKIVKINKERSAKVTGVVKDFASNASFKFKALGSWAMLEADMPWMKTSGWGNYSFKTYVMVKPGTDMAKLNAKVSGFIAKNDPNSKSTKMSLFQYSQMHLHSKFVNGKSVGGSIEYVQLFMFLAIVILIFACINFMNLSTARSENRAKEVGVRKAVGAGRFSLVKQFMGESLLMSALSFVFAMILVNRLLPYFNGVIGKNLEAPYGSAAFWLIGLGTVIITGFIAGSYPALFLSSFKPVKVLKGVNKSGKAAMLPRQVLVVLQFTIATVFILSSILIYKQLMFIKSLPAGYDKNNLVELSLDGRLYNDFELFRKDAIEAGAITDGVSTSSSISNSNSSSWGITWPGQLPGEDKIPIDQLVTTYHFVSTFNVKLMEGRDFDMGRPSDSTAIMINRAAVKLMRLKEPLGTQVYWQGAQRTVVGVIQDFILGDPTKPVQPVIVGFMKDWAGTASIRLNNKLSVSDAIAKLNAVYKKYNPEYPFDYKFVDEQYAEKFSTEQLLGTLANSFTILAIVISCLGLFGLASFSAEQRRKEIGIRKVLGASIANLWFNLSKEFVQLVIIGFIIGGAISWYPMNEWLHKYTFHTDIGPWVFVATIVISLAVTMTTVSWQAIKAAITNPVKNLRSE